MSLHLIWNSVHFETRSAELKIFENLTEIGSLNAVPGALCSEGNIYGETFKIASVNSHPEPPLVNLTIHKGISSTGSMSWTLGNGGLLSLLKKTRGANNFNIRKVSNTKFQLLERDKQRIAEINTGSNETMIWDADVTSNQRSERDVHELLFYSGILIGRAFPRSL